MSSNQPLLPQGSAEHSDPAPRSKRLITLFVPLVLVLATVGVLLFGESEPSDPLKKANYWLKTCVVVRAMLTIELRS